MKKPALLLLLLLAVGCTKKQAPSSSYIPSNLQTQSTVSPNVNGQKARAFSMDTLYLVILKHQLKIKTLETVEKNEKSATRDKNGAPQPASEPAPGRIRLKIALTGSSNHLLGFIADLEAAKKFIALQKLQLSHNPDSGSQTDALLDAEIDIDPALTQDPVILKMFLPKVGAAPSGPESRSSEATITFPHRHGQATKPITAALPPPQDEDNDRVPLAFDTEGSKGVDSSSPSSFGTEMVNPTNPGQVGRPHSQLGAVQSPSAVQPPSSFGATNGYGSPSGAKLGVEFLGTMSDGFTVEAILSVKDEIKLVARGESFQGFQVTDIQPDRITVSGPGGTQTLTLEEETPQESTIPSSPNRDIRREPPGDFNRDFPVPPNYPLERPQPQEPPQP